MKTLNVVFEDKEYADLEKAKGDMTWRVFVLTLVK